MRRRFGRSADEEALPSFSEVRARGSTDDDESRQAVVTAYTKELQRREAQKPEEPVWKCKCSASVLVALLIWFLITVFVLHMIGDAQRRATDQDGPVTIEMLRSGIYPSPPDKGKGTKAPSAADATKKLLPAGCLGSNCRQEGGSEEFGSILGTHNNVFAFGNCFHSTCFSMLENWIDVPIPRDAAERLRSTAETEGSVIDAGGRFLRHLSTGMKWQCVEYARRYWMLAGSPEPAIFGDVEGAADIWDLTDVQLLDGTPMPLLKYTNGLPRGSGGDAPRVGDIVIYGRHADSIPYGHVAVVVGLDVPTLAPGDVEAEGVVYLAEQNWHNAPWPGPFHNYSRTIPLRIRTTETGRFTHTMDDPFVPVQGWARYGRD